MNKVLVMKCRGNLPSGAPGLGTAFCCSRVALPAAFVTNRQVPRSSGFRTPEYLGIGQLSQAGPHTRFSSYERQAVIYRLPRRRTRIWSFPEKYPHPLPWRSTKATAPVSTMEETKKECVPTPLGMFKSYRNSRGQASTRKSGGVKRQVGAKWSEDSQVRNMVS